MKFRIKCHIDCHVLFEGEFGSLKLCVEAAVESKANLWGADLREANLWGADLRGANLTGADLSSTSLCGATIDGAVLNSLDIGGPGHILCALTDDEWQAIKTGRSTEASAEKCTEAVSTT